MGPARTVILTRDSPVFQGPLIYRGGLLVGDGIGAGVADLYDGGSNNGLYLDQFRTSATTVYDRHWLDSGIFVLRGVYADFNAAILAFVLYYDVDLPEALGGPRSGP